MKHLVWLLLVAVVVVVVWARSRRAAGPHEVGERVGRMTPQQESLFTAKVDRYFRARGEKVTIADGVARYDGGWYGLQNLCQACACAPEAQWDELISKHFELLGRAQAASPEAVSFDMARSRLGLCLKQEKDVPMEKLIAWHDLPGMVTYLVLDGAETVQTVPPERLETWGKTANELRPVALELVRREAGITHKQVDAGDGITVHLLIGKNLYAAAHALLLEEHQGVVGKRGCLVAVPMDQMIICYPIDGVEAVGAVHKVAYLAMKRFEEGPGSVSPDLYWYCDGKYTRIDVKISQKELVVRPPVEFVDMLNSLAGTK